MTTAVIAPCPVRRTGAGIWEFDWNIVGDLSPDRWRLENTLGMEAQQHLDAWGEKLLSRPNTTLGAAQSLYADALCVAIDINVRTLHPLTDAECEECSAAAWAQSRAEVCEATGRLQKQAADRRFTEQMQEDARTGRMLGSVLALGVAAVAVLTILLAPHALHWLAKEVLHVQQ